jgi:two-component system OmpR family response regulator
MIKILYAEDEEDIRTIAKIALEDIGGFNVKYCENGKEVLQVIDAFQPDLLLLDVMMPGMDGPTIVKKIRENPQFKKLPTIFMTAKIQPNEIMQYQEMGVVDVITKPFDPMKLADTIRSTWNKYSS